MIMIIKERCAEESENFVEKLIDIMYSIQEGKTGLKVSKEIAATKARNLIKCITKSD